MGPEVGGGRQPGPWAGECPEDWQDLGCGVGMTGRDFLGLATGVDQSLWAGLAAGAQGGRRGEEAGHGQLTATLVPQAPSCLLAWLSVISEPGQAEEQWRALGPGEGWEVSPEWAKGRWSPEHAAPAWPGAQCISMEATGPSHVLSHRGDSRAAWIL